jgi:hypothetical protein
MTRNAAVVMRALLVSSAFGQSLRGFGMHRLAVVAVLASGCGHAARVDLVGGRAYGSSTLDPEADRPSTLAPSATAGETVAEVGDAYPTVGAEAQPRQHVHGVAAERPTACALSADGTRVAWGGFGRVVVETIGRTRTQVLEVPYGNRVDNIAFLADGRLVARIGISAWTLGGSKPPKERVEYSAGAWMDTPSLPWARELLEELAFRGIRPRQLARYVRDEDGRHFLATSGARPQLYLVRDGAAKRVSMRPGEVLRLGTAPGLLVVTQADPSSRYERIRGWNGLDAEHTISVYDVPALERLWTREARGPSFSADGRRIGFIDDEGGAIADARTGAILLRRDHLP